MSDALTIEVVYALPERQTVLTLRVGAGTSVQAAIEQSGILARHPEIDLSVNKFGIYSRLAKATDLLQDGDRIEIYRPLTADPKEMRKKRAEKAKEEGRADVVTGGRPNASRKRGEEEGS
ncbi:RnfH family protein [Aeromonas crassostreae]